MHALFILYYVPDNELKSRESAADLFHFMLDETKFLWKILNYFSEILNIYIQDVFSIGAVN